LDYLKLAFVLDDYDKMCSLMPEDLDINDEEAIVDPKGQVTVLQELFSNEMFINGQYIIQNELVRALYQRRLALAMLSSPLVSGNHSMSAVRIPPEIMQNIAQLTEHHPS
jgi:hypothetical protein